MKRFFALIFLSLLYYNQLYAQHYLRGKVVDEKGNGITEVKMRLFSTKQVPYSNGNDGSFGLNSAFRSDTLYLIADGFENLSVVVNVNQFNYITMKAMQKLSTLNKKGLASKTKDLDIEANLLDEVTGESYKGLVENKSIQTVKNPETSYSLSVDRAAYSNVRRFINNGLRVPEDAIRVEEMLNYFDFRDATDVNTKSFLCKSNFTTCPWNKKHHLLFINTIAPKVNVEDLPPSNLVLLIDISGSMERPNRLPLLQTAFKMLVDNLRPQDRVAIVTYGGGVEVELHSTSGSNKTLIKNEIDSLEASGDTPGAGAIKTAYDVAKKAFIKGGNNRVILATDGDFNVGQTTDKELEEIIAQQKQSGIYLTCIGVGMGNYKDSKLETLAKTGNGNFAYLDNIQEAEKVFLQEFGKTIYAVAKDAFVNVAFNKNTVKEYRLIGYDNKSDAIADTSNNLSGGDIGSGHSAMAVFEIELYDRKIIDYNIGEIFFQYKLPNSDTVHTVKNAANFQTALLLDSINTNLRFAAGICMYSSILRKSKYARGFDFDDISTLVSPICDRDNYLQQEFLSLLVKSENIYLINKPKKKKKEKKEK